jgi:hypothetical protein
LFWSDFLQFTHHLRTLDAVQFITTKTPREKIKKNTRTRGITAKGKREGSEGEERKEVVYLFFTFFTNVSIHSTDNQHTSFFIII